MMAYPELATAKMGDKTVTVWHDQDTEEPYLEHVELKRIRREREAFEDADMMDTCGDCDGYGEYDDGSQCDTCRGEGQVNVCGVFIWPVNIYDYGANGLRATLSDYDPTHNNTVAHPNGLLVIDDLSKFLDDYNIGGNDGPDFEGLFTSFLNEWTQWASGECYGYTITTPQVCAMCGHDEPDIVDSCGGYIGLDWLIEAIKEEHRELGMTEGDLEWQ